MNPEESNTNLDDPSHLGNLEKEKRENFQNDGAVDNSYYSQHLGRSTRQAGAKALESLFSGE